VKLELEGSIWHYMDAETVKAHGPWVRHSDYARLQEQVAILTAELTGERGRSESLYEQGVNAEIRAEAAEAERDRLREALESIVSSETASANATVKRIVRIALAALQKEHQP